MPSWHVPYALVLAALVTPAVILRNAQAPSATTAVQLPMEASVVTTVETVSTVVKPFHRARGS